MREMLKPAGWEGLFLFTAGLAMVLLSSHLTNHEKIAVLEAETKIF